jgi:hypothetical protein
MVIGITIEKPRPKPTSLPFETEIAYNNQLGGSKGLGDTVQLKPGDVAIIYREGKLVEGHFPAVSKPGEVVLIYQDGRLIKAIVPVAPASTPLPENKPQ